MTKNRIELQTVILAMLCTLAVAVIGQKTLYEYQEVKREKIQLTQKENICQLIEVAPYVSWFQSLDRDQIWNNDAFNKEFGAYPREQVMQQLNVMEPEVIKTAKPKMQLVHLKMNEQEKTYNVLTYPVLNKQGKIAGIGGVAVADTLLPNNTRVTLQLKLLRPLNTDY